LLFGKYLLNPVVALTPFFQVKGASTLFQKTVNLGVPETDEVQFLGSCFARMPDIIEIRVLADGPPHNYRIEVPLVDILAEKCSPLDYPGLNLDADSFETLLDNLQGFCPFSVALIGYYDKLERLAVLSIAITAFIFPACLASRRLARSGL
jgi:hypothetical protein